MFYIQCGINVHAAQHNDILFPAQGWLGDGHIVNRRDVRYEIFLIQGVEFTVVNRLVGNKTAKIPVGDRYD